MLESLRTPVDAAGNSYRVEVDRRADGTVRRLSLFFVLPTGHEIQVKTDETVRGLEIGAEVAAVKMDGFAFDVSSVADRSVTVRVRTGRIPDSDEWLAQYFRDIPLDRLVELLRDPKQLLLEVTQPPDESDWVDDVIAGSTVDLDSEPELIYLD